MAINRYNSVSAEDQIKRNIVGEYPWPPLSPLEPKYLSFEKINLLHIIYRDKYFLMIIIGFYFWMYMKNDFYLFYVITFIGLMYLAGCFLPIIFENKKIRKYNEELKRKYELSILNYNIAKIKYISDHNDYQKRVEQNKHIIEAKIEEFILKREKARENFAFAVANRKSQNKTSTIINTTTIQNNFTPKPEKSDIDINSNTTSDIEVLNIIQFYSGVCAVIAIQPIPFADIFILTPTQIIMGNKIAKARGYEISENSIKNILKEISGIIGMGVIAQQLIIGAYKTFLPFLGGITTIPVVYGLTFGIGKVMDFYILANINGEMINKSDVANLFKISQKEGKQEGKQRENQIIAESKKSK